MSLGLTLVPETAVALLCGVRKKALILVILVNILTNPAVVYLHLLLRSFFPLAVPLWQIPLELCAVLTEGFCYSRTDSGIKHPWRLAVIANLCSYSLGLLINMI